MLCVAYVNIYAYIHPYMHAHIYNAQLAHTQVGRVEMKNRFAFITMPNAAEAEEAVSSLGKRYIYVCV